MKVSTAIDTRMSCRAFTDQAVPAATLREILTLAARAPSGGNLQPWLVHAVVGDKLCELRAMIAAKLPNQPNGEGAEYPIYPPELKEPYRSRRFKCGEDLYATIGVTRDNKPGRLAQFARNYQFFGAPQALFFSIDRQMGSDQWSDLGMFMQSIMLLAREYGLHTCAQEAWSVWHKTLGEFLGLTPNVMFFCGMAIGHRDESAPINRLRTDRAPQDEWLRFIGA